MPSSQGQKGIYKLNLQAGGLVAVHCAWDAGIPLQAFGLQMPISTLSNPHPSFPRLKQSPEQHCRRSPATSLNLQPAKSESQFQNPCSIRCSHDAGCTWHAQSSPPFDALRNGSGGPPAYRASQGCNVEVGKLAIVFPSCPYVRIAVSCTYKAAVVGRLKKRHACLETGLVFCFKVWVSSVSGLGLTEEVNLNAQTACTGADEENPP